MQNNLNLFFFCDALGWRIVQEFGFCKDILPFRKRVRTQFGYSSGAVPTILSGKTPAEHGHFSSFFYSPQTSPFRFMRFFPLFLMPDRLFNRHKVKHQLAKLIRMWNGYTGYFELYQMPYGHLPFFDYTEKKDIFVQGGLDRVPNLADVWSGQKRAFHISNWRKSSKKNIEIARQWIEAEQGNSVFLYTAELDSFLHFHVSEPDAVRKELAMYEVHVRNLLQSARKHYRKVNFHLFSDHGMAPLKGTMDVRDALKHSGAEFGKNCCWVLDSTMARFWFFTDDVRKCVMDAFSGFPGHFLSQNEKEIFGVNFSNHQYGDEIFLCDPGVQIAPGDMGHDALPGMHGYSPDDIDSDSALLSLEMPAVDTPWIGDFFHLMTHL